MSYLPSPYTGFYTRIDNALLTGAALVGALSPQDIRALEFEAASSVYPAYPIGGTGVRLSVAQLMQATLDSLPVCCTGISGTTGYIDLGADTVSNAAGYLSLFGLSTSTAGVNLKFVRSDDSTVNASLYLRTSDGTNTNVDVNVVGSGAVANILFGSGQFGGPLFYSASTFLQPAVSWPGAERVVYVHSKTLTSGSEQVNFDILAYSQ